MVPLILGNPRILRAFLKLGVTAIRPNMMKSDAASEEEFITFRTPIFTDIIVFPI